MTTTNPSSPQPPVYYDFARPDLWSERIGSIDDAVDTTFKLLNSSAVTVGGLTARKFMRLVSDAGGLDFTHLLEEALGEGTAGAEARLTNALDRELEQTGINSFSLFLYDLLRALLRTGQLSLATPETNPTWDGDFELKQMLNLYQLILGLNSFFWGDVRPGMSDVLDAHAASQTPPPLHLIRACFRLIGVDAEILQRAIVQRRWRADSAGHYTRSLQATSLLVTDKLAALALAPFQQQLPGVLDVKPLTYFSRETHIHRLPYSDRFLLVGLSYDLLPPEASRRFYGATTAGGAKGLPAFELMAIPHEVGHFVYHNARLNDGTTCLALGEHFQENPYGRWAEEIFADTYGCLVAGPLTALGLQAILATGDRAQIAVDDGEHPTPIVRPFVLSEILRELGRQQPDRYAFAQAIESLDANWAGILQRWGFEIVETVESGGALRIALPGPAGDYRETVVNVTKLLDALRPMIQAFVQKLLENANLSPWAGAAGNELSADIPWNREDYADLTQYDGVMARLSGDDVAYRAVPGYQISHIGDRWWQEEGESPDQRLAHFVAQWIDSGATGHGDHPR